VTVERDSPVTRISSRRVVAVPRRTSSSNRPADTGLPGSARSPSIVDIEVAS
jgi:hypothetical protein